MAATLNEFEQILKHNGTPFLAGDSLSIADLLYYFELTNLTVYGKEKSLASFKLASTWFNRIG